ncbi:MAG: hypothetical protein GC206_07560 [Alphaproteobacteria bacterium]|nr:hypothetical protein [Alphaproteobacteria bacterium]
MNERQRDLFLWLWSRRRARGRMGAAIVGALIGLAGGLVFTVLFFGLPEMAGQSVGELNTDEMSPFTIAIANQLGPRGFVLLLAGGLFGLLGAGLAWRVYGMQEGQYQALLAQGARVPAARPHLRFSDRAPLFAVFAVVAAIAIFLIVMLVIEFGRGGL